MKIKVYNQLHYGIQQLKDLQECLGILSIII